jgi:DNA-directed RNA polymerase subunit K/omega
MSVDTIPQRQFAIPAGESAVDPVGAGFHVVTLACLRLTQIRNGARLRMDPRGHKPCVVAVAEVLAGAVPYYLA